MADPNWDQGLPVTVPAKPRHGYSTKVVDYIDASKRLKFVAQDHRQISAQQPGQAPVEVENKWNYTHDKQCTADGEPTAAVNPANCLLPQAPPGALIAKIGGSTAGRTDGLQLFVVGSFCVIDFDEKTKGTLYLTMNADPMGSLDRGGELAVTIYR
jgi:hypothetical protein